jgi:hypothetical protein
MVNNQFVDDSLLLLSVEWRSVGRALACLDMFCTTSGFVVNAHKTSYWLVGLDVPLDWIPTTWTHIWPRVVMRYLGIPFGVCGIGVFNGFRASFMFSIIRISPLLGSSLLLDALQASRVCNAPRGLLLVPWDICTILEEGGLGLIDFMT